MLPPRSNTDTPPKCPILNSAVMPLTRGSLGLPALESETELFITLFIYLLIYVVPVRYPGIGGHRSLPPLFCIPGVKEPVVPVLVMGIAESGTEGLGSL